MTAGSIDWSLVEQEISAITAQGGIAGVALIGPNGASFTQNGDRLFRAASTIKIAIMIEVFRQIERGNLTHRDLFRLDDEDRTPGSGVLAHLHEGLPLTVDDLLYLMMAISDNTATNMLIDLTDMDGINLTMEELGLTVSRIHRKMLGRTPAEGEPENWVNVADLAQLMQAIVGDSAASPESCAGMRGYLSLQQNLDRIARHLPPGTTWGSKTGSLPNVVNDVGFITTERSSLTLAIFIEGLIDRDGEAAIGNIARAAWTSLDLFAE